MDERARGQYRSDAEDDQDASALFKDISVRRQEETGTHFVFSNHWHASFSDHRHAAHRLTVIAGAEGEQSAYLQGSE